MPFIYLFRLNLCKYQSPGDVDLDGIQALPSQVKSQTNNNAFCIAQRAKAYSKTGFDHDFGAAEAPPVFYSGLSDCMLLFYIFCSFKLLV
jgi:hypothetical protein